MNTVSIFFLSLIMMVSFGIKGQNIEGGITEKEQREVISIINELLIENYVFPEVAKEMAEFLNSKFSEADYSSITQAKDYADELTKDLQSVSKDKHLKVIFDPVKILEMQEAQKQNGNTAMQESQLNKMKETNFGFKEVEILEGNIGYINLTSFYPVDLAKNTAISAMEQLKNTDAIIFDLRQNGGGSPMMIQLLSSYFFDEPVHLNTFYFRPMNSYQEVWTLEKIDGEKMIGHPIYILTSNSTFSAAEEFAYNLKNLNRATVVGEVTGGGAHPGGIRMVSDRFMIFLPLGRAINPITNTNWEGTGVKPDIEVAAIDALEKALELVRG